MKKEILFYLIALLGNILANYSTHFILIKCVTCYPLLLFYVYGYRDSLGDISIRKYIAFKITAVIQFITISSFYNVKSPLLMYVALFCFFFILISVLIEFYLYNKSSDSFYIKIIKRQTFVVLITGVSYVNMIFS